MHIAMILSILPVRIITTVIYSHEIIKLLLLIPFLEKRCRSQHQIATCNLIDGVIRSLSNAVHSSTNFRVNGWCCKSMKRLTLVLAWEVQQILAANEAAITRLRMVSEKRVN